MSKAAPAKSAPAAKAAAPAAKAAPKAAAPAKAAAAKKAPVIAASRPLVGVHKIDSDAVIEQITLPTVFVAPIRPDIVHFVHTSLAKNKRQAYAVSPGAGHQHSAESWGTGRAVARIPRVAGGGNSRSGQGAFGNMCRKGRMFAPTKTWRRWHRKVNVNQKRFAVASALAASALPGIVFARGHNINAVPEVPLVLDTALESMTKTKQAIATLKAVGAFADVLKAKNSRKLRAGIGKLRARRHVQRRGPLVVYNNDHGVVRAFRNLPGVEVAHVDSLNLLQLAPGGHLGRFVIWSRDAFNKLNANWGSFTRKSAQKSGYHVPRPLMQNSDLTRLINSDEIQSKIRPSVKSVVRASKHRNPLTNLGARVKLNPYAAVIRRAEVLRQQRRDAKVDANRSKELANAKAAQKKHNQTQKMNNYKLITVDGFSQPKVVRKAAPKKEKKAAAPAAKPAAKAAGKK